jgi:hypothetical protein
MDSDVVSHLLGPLMQKERSITIKNKSKTWACVSWNYLFLGLLYHIIQIRLQDGIFILQKECLRCSQSKFKIKIQQMECKHTI